MIRVTIYSLTMPPSPMFRQSFAEKLDADRYEAFWRKLGSCHIRRVVDEVPPPPHVDEAGKVTFF